MSETQEIQEITLTVTEFIQRISKELNIFGTNGIYGNELELIALVRNCQFLYDKNLPDFKNVQKKNEAWEAIASIFTVSVGEVQNRWKTMRDSFNKRRNKTLNPDSDNRLVSCPFYENLLFLEPYIFGRRSSLSRNNQGVSKSFLEFTPEPSENNFLQHNGIDFIGFIERIKSFPLLYHKKYVSSSYRKEKLAAWMNISREFGLPAKECLARWKNLRERYAKERKLMHTQEGVRKWEFYDSLSFLNEHVRPRRRPMKLDSTSDEAKVCYVVTSGTDSSSNPATVDSSQFLNEAAEPTKKEVTIEDVEFFDVSSDITSSPTPLFNEQNYLADDTNSNSQVESSRQSNKNGLDEDDLFGQSIAAELRLISCPRKKIKLKADIYKLLYENHCE